MAKGQTVGERVASLEEWTEGHEARCEERVNDIKDSVKALQKQNWVLILAVAGWALSQLYDTLAHPHQPQSVMINTPAAVTALPHP